MGRFRFQRSLRGLVVLPAIAILVLVGIPAIAGDDEGSGGHINPTNFPVIDIDIEYDRTVDQPAAARVEALVAHQTATGAGIVVAVLDGGFNLAHPMIMDRLHPLAYDALDGDDDPNDSGNGIDDDGDGFVDPAVGHGTFVAGMVLMAAPDATIVPIRVVDDEGYGTSEQIAAGVDFARQLGVDVINLSLQADRGDPFIKPALLLAESQGITIVVSGGNDGLQGEKHLETLAEEKFVLAVGSLDDQDVVTDFTSLPGESKSWLKVYTPGVDLWGPYGWPTDETVAFWSGTSFSAGIVSGGVALYLQLNPGEEPKDVRKEMVLATDMAYDHHGSPLPVGGCLNLRKIVD